MPTQQQIDDTLPTVNYLLPAATPMGAYAMGMITALAWEDGEVPDQQLMEHVSRCQSTADAAKLWLQHRDAQRAAPAADDEDESDSEDDEADAER